MRQLSYDHAVPTALDSVPGRSLMILTIFVVWLVLATLAALFVYCCSVVSNGPRQELRRDEFLADAPTYFTTSTGADTA
jgi:hypothetical protein